MSTRGKILAAVMVGIVLVGAAVGGFFLYATIHRIPVVITPPNVDAAQLVEEDGKIKVRYTPHGADTPTNEAVESYFRRVYDQRQQYSFSRRIMMKTLNISSPGAAIWVLIGLLGQVLFAGRMIVQWIATEKHRRSVVPTSFWWLAIGGATLLITYFIWRKDVIGVLGQATGWVIYVRNLYFIYSGHHDTATAQGTPDEPADTPTT